MAKKKSKGKTKKEPAASPKSKTVFPFYSEDRWNNWIEQVKESGFELNEDEDPGDSGKIFVNMEDDIILACLKVIAKYQNNELTGDGAFDALDEVKNIVLNPMDSISEPIDLMLDSLQTSLIGVFASCECYIDGAYDKSADLTPIIKSALEAEEADDPGTAIGYVATIGASVIAGAEIPEDTLSDMPYGLVAEWIDGIDSISAAMMGDDSYKFDEADE
ncbi:MAG: DUF2150 family protein [ANME-2 cluster archaeon]|nr:DUF2150 family protein [ANME-2 cluster archaeon]MBC2702872.1 DUF2150 family protein [ANME-2 cluster archaeon]MBC2706439.1 DUF2150 family protein [ANME-2 cluster archaeon]MBC2747732.1 DUF2150 family protein [ANME-2 cluster archaeon]MBC2761782.1 DUF2150 family protein [ANME-2 cluster archaeon]